MKKGIFAAIQYTMRSAAACVVVGLLIAFYAQKGILVYAQINLVTIVCTLALITELVSLRLKK